MFSTSSRLISTAAIALTIAGCASTGDTFDNRTAISLGSGAAGALVCNQVFKDRGSRSTLTALCGVGGFFLGRAFTQKSNTVLESNSTGQSSTWNDPDAGQVTMMPTRTYYNESQAPCRDYSTTVTIEGEPSETMHGTACRQADGSWAHNEM